MSLTNDVTEKLVHLVQQIESGEKSHLVAVEKLYDEHEIPAEQRLHSALEAHMLEYIGKNKAINATHIADELRITRGGVTKIAARLIKRGLIEKFQLQGNRKEVYYKLTSAGKKTDAVHAEMHQRLMSELDEIIDEYSEEEKARILVFIDRVMQVI